MTANTSSNTKIGICAYTSVARRSFSSSGRRDDSLCTAGSLYAILHMVVHCTECRLIIHLVRPRPHWTPTFAK